MNKIIPLCLFLCVAGCCSVPHASEKDNIVAVRDFGIEDLQRHHFMNEMRLSDFQSHSCMLKNLILLFENKEMMEVYSVDDSVMEMLGEDLIELIKLKENIYWKERDLLSRYLSYFDIEYRFLFSECNESFNYIFRDSIINLNFDLNPERPEGQPESADENR